MEKPRIIIITSKDSIGLEQVTMSRGTFNKLNRYIENLESEVENLGIHSVSGSVECECIESNRTQVSDPNSYPHGEWIEYDKCNDCGKWHNLKVR